jgi:predicted nucleic acid-binding protein
LILYLDTSALVKLYAEEPGSDEVRNAAREARGVAVSEVGYVETRSALARKEREGFFSTEEHDVAVESLKRDFREVYLARPVTGEVIARAGELVREHTLRAYDAIHLATALALREEASELLAQRGPAQESPEEGDELVVLLMTYDSSLSEAAHKERLAYEPEHPGEQTN